MRKSLITASLLVLVIALAGCQAQETAPVSLAEAPSPSADESVTTYPELRTPDISRNFADPDILFTQGAYYAFATNHNLNNVQVARSEKLEAWEVLLIDALPNLPKWALPGLTWAPEVTEFPDGSYRMYFTARNAAFPKQCIGVAASQSPIGPFVAVGDSMLVCPEELGGAIDASVFFENETPYLLWKNDGNCCGIQTDLFIQELSADGLTLAGDPKTLLTTSESWEGILVEAPTLIKQGGKYHLFYSANDYYSDQYAVGHAISDSLFGDYKKVPQPFLTSANLDEKVIGPGGQDVILDQEGNWRVFFHGWNISKSARYMYSLLVSEEQPWPQVIR